MQITLTSATNPRWTSPEQKAVVLDCTFEHLGSEVVPFTAQADDPEAHGRDIYSRALAGDFGPIAAHAILQSAVPQTVTRFQARTALAQAGLFTSVEAYMATLPADNIQRLAWQDAQEFRRTSPTVLALAQMLGLTATQLDELFRAAALIEA